MKLVAFDVECSNMMGRQYEVCAFSFCIFDERFNVQDRDVFWIRVNKPAQKKNPMNEYVDRFIDATGYPEIYDKIRGVFDGADHCLAHDKSKMDCKYLGYMNECYGKEQFWINLVDTMAMVKKYKPKMEKYNLEAVCKEFGIQHTPHEPQSDADACMEILRLIHSEMIGTLDETLNYFESMIVMC